jgi:peroxiredoxin
MDAYRDQYATLYNGGQNVVLLAISVDPDTMLAAWAKEKGYPFRFLSDSGAAVGRRYGVYSFKYKVDNRTLFVIGPDGRIVDVQAPFREIDPAAYQRLETVVDSLAKPAGGS